MTSLDATVNTNETLSGGSVTHVGQMFLDQDLISLVEAEEPYASNTQELTTNAEDSILSEEAETVDPFVEYVLLGDSVADGIFGWLAFGIDTTASYNITPAAYLTDNGGVENENSGGGMGGAPGGSGGPPSGAVPSGAMPTGAMPSGANSSVAAATSSTLLAVSSSDASSLDGKATSSAHWPALPNMLRLTDTSVAMVRTEQERPTIRQPSKATTKTPQECPTGVEIRCRTACSVRGFTVNEAYGRGHRKAGELGDDLAVEQDGAQLQESSCCARI
jgi:hypothetical protein